MASTVSCAFSREFDYKFKQKHSFEDRVKIYNDIIKQNPNKIPIVVEFDDKAMKKSLKFLYDYDEIVMRLVAKIRATDRQSTSSSIFILTDNNISLMSTQSIGELYKEYLCEKERMNRECDKILYLMVFSENTFG